MLRDGGGDRQTRRDRFILAAERLIDAAHELRAEARRKRRARTVEYISDVFESDLRERFDRFRSKSQCGEGKRRDRASCFAHGYDAISAEPCHRPRTSHRIGDRDARLITLRLKPPRQIGRERGLAAEQMRAAGNVEHQPVGRLEPDQRCVAVAPVGDRFEQREVRMLVGIRDPDLRIHRACVGQRHADF